MDEEPEIVESEDVECGTCNNEGRDMKIFRSPLLPSKADVEHHELTHCPYRSWCRHCVRGRGVEASHFKARQEI